MIIKEKRKDMGLTQGDLAVICSVSQCTVSQWELGKISPPVDKLIIMSDLFGCTIDELVRGEKANDNKETDFQTSGKVRKESEKN